MILADKILNLRKKNGWSQEDLAEKLNVSRQSISKWEGAIAIPDINKIIDMAKLFGVTTDYLLKDDINETIYSSDDTDEKTRKVTLDEANAFVNVTKSYSIQIALGVFLCIISPTLLIFLTGYSEYCGKISEEIACTLGLSFLFIAIASAILIFILSSARVKKFSFFEKEKFELEYGVESIIKDKKEKYTTKFNIGISISVVLLILAVLPLIITAILIDDDFILICMTILLLVLVAIGVFILVKICMTKSTFDQILSEDDYSKQYKEENKKGSRFAGFYWPIVTAGYLCWSFITLDWNITWIVWPLAGLIFAGISALLHTNNN